MAQLILNGVVTGLIVALPAIALSLTFAILKFPNFAIGAMLTFAAYIAWALNTLAGVPLVGDSLRDLECAEAVGALPILVKTGKGPKTLSQLETAQAAGKLLQTLVFDDLAAFTESLLRGDLQDAVAASRG